ncbi:MAG: hypothetical protein CMQ15_17665 [Gammaproteobacteria bacterium]|jgi:hypothetical protein|nr:hypothetical protein [Gammaproteobacteria bacterium]HAX45855.1 hypothetical protein [Nitrospina sp.]|tara:strand:+ start:92 stop:295 length:204 start_codon:yes stop_codon:yes gene_type:complete
MKGGANMFNKVRVYNSQDQLTKTITPKELSKDYWKKNLTLEKKIKLTKRAKNDLYLQLPELEADLFI